MFSSLSFVVATTSYVEGFLFFSRGHQFNA